MRMYTATIPLSQIIIPPICVIHWETSEHLEAVISSSKLTGTCSHQITVRLIDNKFEALDSAHIVFALSHNNVSSDIKVNVLVVDISDREAVKMIFSHVLRQQDPHPLLISDSLNKIHDIYGLSDSEISTWVGEGFTRSKVNHFRNFRNLSSSAKKHFRLNHFKVSIAKTLSYMTHVEQDKLIEKYSVRNFIGINTLIESKKTKSLKTAEQPPKTIAEKKFENHISELVGAPISISVNDTGVSLSAKFFSKEELQNINEHIIDHSNVAIVGELILTFKNIDHFNDFIDPIFKGDDF